MTTTAFIEAQKQLVRILAHHMIQIAERAHVLDSQKAGGRILENVYRLWDGKPVFRWEIVQLDVPRELEENSYLFLGNNSVQSRPEIGSAGMSCAKLPVNMHEACLWNSRSDTVSSGNYNQGSTFGVTGTTENPTLGRCVFCNDALDADGLCWTCLLPDLDVPIDETPKDLDVPPHCQMVSDTQTSAMTSSIPSRLPMVHHEPRTN